MIDPRCWTDWAEENARLREENARLQEKVTTAWETGMAEAAKITERFWSPEFYGRCIDKQSDLDERMKREGELLGNRCMEIEEAIRREVFNRLGRPPRFEELFNAPDSAARTAIGENHAQEPFDHTGAPR